MLRFISGIYLGGVAGIAASEICGRDIPDWEVGSFDESWEDYALKKEFEKIDIEDELKRLKDKAAKRSKTEREENRLDSKQSKRE